MVDITATRHDSATTGSVDATSGDPVADLLVANNAAPARIRAASNLAEDTLFAEPGPSPRDGVATAMFTSPFSTMEEFLYVDSGYELRHAYRYQTSSVGTWDAQRIAYSVREVAAAVHPAGAVHAFSITMSNTLEASRLLDQRDRDANWVPATIRSLPPAARPSRLFVQYTNDRPATPTVFAVEELAGGGGRVHVILPLPLAADPAQPLWQWAWSFDLDPRDVPGLDAIGLDLVNPSGEVAPYVARAYAVDDQSVLWCTVSSPDQAAQRVQLDSGWGEIAGVVSAPTGAGCVGVSRMGTELLVTIPFRRTDGTISTVTPLDQPLSRVTAWQDANNLLHVYGMQEPSGTVHVVHQLAWLVASPEHVPIPQPGWDTHSSAQGIDTATTRPLFPRPARFDVDAYPDDMPSLLAMYADAPVSDAVVLYTQQAGTSYWEREPIMTTELWPVGDPVSLTRYKSRVTVLNGYGAPVPGCSVTVTADGPLDLEARGGFYRTDRDVPLRLTTDATGALTLSTPATGLSVPTLHVSVPGVTDALTLQPAAEVHRFFAGTGALPGHSEGFTARSASGATNPDGSLLFPKLRGAGPEDQLPTAQELVDWCAGAFAVTDGGPLPPSMTSELADGEEVLAFSLQTHDPTRPGVQVYSSEGQLAARRQTLAELGVVEYASEWFGDVIEGLRSGVLSIIDVSVFTAERMLQVIIRLADGVLAGVQAVWDDAVSAAHAVEAFCSAAGAQIVQVVDYLSWSFGFGDVWDSKTAIEATVSHVLPGLTTVLDQVQQLGSDWFAEHRQQIADSFARAKESFAGESLARIEAPALLDGMDLPPQAQALSHVGDPHVLWLTDLFQRYPADPHGSGPAEPDADPGGPDPLSDIMAALRGSPLWPQVMSVVEQVGQAFYDFANPTDPRSVYTRTMSALLGIFEQIALATVDFTDGVLTAVITAMKAMVVALEAELNAPSNDYFGSLVYRYVATCAGRPIPPEVLVTDLELGALYAAYPFTVLAKQLLGTAPFPGGTVPTLPPIGPPTGSPENSARPSSGQLETVPAAGPGLGAEFPVTPGVALYYRAMWQYIQAIAMTYDGIIFDPIVASSAWYPDSEFPASENPGDRFWKVNGLLHFTAYAVGDWPWLWGGPVWTNWATAPGLQFWSWLGSIFNNTGELFCAFHSKRSFAMWEDVKGIGPIATGVSGVIRIALSVARYYQTGSQSSTDWLNMWINIASFESAASGLVRFAYRLGVLPIQAMLIKGMFDMGCGAFAGGTTLYQTVYMMAKPPRVWTMAPQPAYPTVGKEYSAQWFFALDGWTPYSFQLVDPETKKPVDPPPGMVWDQATATLSGTPTVAGHFPCNVMFSDYSGPAYTAEWSWDLAVYP